MSITRSSIPGTKVSRLGPVGTLGTVAPVGILGTVDPVTCS